MIGAHYFPEADDSFACETPESGHLLALYSDTRMSGHKHLQKTGSKFHDDKGLSAAQSLPLGYPGQDIESFRSIGAGGDQRFAKQTEYRKSQTKMDATMKHTSMFPKHDPRRVAVSWYSYYYLRPGSPTQWEQRDNKETDLDERLSMAMGLVMEDPASLKPDDDIGPLKSDISLLEKLSKMVDTDNVMDQTDVEVADIFNDKARLLRHLNTGQFTKWQDLENETGQLLSELRRSSPPV